MSLILKSEFQTENTDTIVCIDGSYVIYHTLFSAVNEWSKDSPYSDVINDIDVTENFERVDITQYPDFLDTLTGKIIKAFSTIDRLVKEFNNLNISKTRGKMFFVLDPDHGSKYRSWRYMIYPEYKGQRSETRDKKPFDVIKCFKQTVDIIKENRSIAEKFNFSVISAKYAEADDIIATVFTDNTNKNINKFLIASDKDYLQLENVVQMNLEGKLVEIEQPYPDKIILNPKTYLLAKIITGDVSDNITQVFNRVGYKTAIKKFVMDGNFLNESLENDSIALNKFNRNTKLIDFGKIPEKIKAIARKAIAEVC